MKLFKTGQNPERDAFFIPRSVQQSIPIKRIYKDGIFEVSGKFSKTWRFFDVNYKVASPEKQMELFMSYCDFLNALPVNAAAKITLFNRRLNQKEFSRTLLRNTTIFSPTRRRTAIISFRRNISPSPWRQRTWKKQKPFSTVSAPT